MLNERNHTESPDSAGEAVDALPLPTKVAQRSGGRRTHRACDRCRVKKSKCNGQQPCNTCKANERTCVFSALRRRDIRKWHCHMQDTVDEAIQRLYRACKECACFPGILPEERDGYVTTEQILQGMGFTNLDLGPRSGGVTGLTPLQILPIRSHSSNIEMGSDSLHESHMHNDQHRNSNHRSESGVIDTPPPVQAHTQAEYHTTPTLHDRYIRQPQTPSLTMSDQFLEAIREQGQSQNAHHQQISHQHYHSHYPHPPQHVIHDGHVGQPDIVSRSHAPPVPGLNFSQCQMPPNYKEQYPQPQFLMYERDFINPQQIWPGPAEIAATSQ